MCVFSALRRAFHLSPMGQWNRRANPFCLDNISFGKPLPSRSQSLLYVIWLSGFVHDTWDSLSLRVNDCSYARSELKTQVSAEWMDEYVSKCRGVRQKTSTEVN